ncbi:hypothetical protein LVJ94_19780 [Pendulispora rubella]|uniref:Uncharacterized protein n=1 Tax=Pendulispora rubella TaxID=2741070 RepID=A0ABZ2LEU2_9BACT
MANASQKSAVGVQILHRTGGMAIAQFGRLCVVVWRDAVTQPTFDLQRAGLDQVVRNHPDGAGFLCVIEPSTRPPDDALRRASAQMVMSHGDHLKCTGVVIEGEGFRAAITRGVLSGMALLLSRKVQAMAFSDTFSALKWMRNYVPVGPIERGTSFIEQVRKELDPLPER